MQIPKPTDADRERFHSLVPDAPQIQTQPMTVAAGVAAGLVFGARDRGSNAASPSTR